MFSHRCCQAKSELLLTILLTLLEVKKRRKMPTENKKLHGVHLCPSSHDQAHRSPSRANTGRSAGSSVTAPPAVPPRRPQRARRAPRQQRTGGAEPSPRHGIIHSPGDGRAESAPGVYTQTPTRTFDYVPCLKGSVNTQTGKQLAASNQYSYLPRGRDCASMRTSSK